MKDIEKKEYVTPMYTAMKINSKENIFTASGCVWIGTVGKSVSFEGCDVNVLEAGSEGWISEGA